jgi:hypothetical protein
MVLLYDFMDVFKLYFAHFFWGLVLLLYAYSVYYNYFKIKKDSEYISGNELMYRFIEAKRRGLIK